MPLKNAENTLKKAISSVLQQKNTKREIVLLIGNDDSTDSSDGGSSIDSAGFDGGFDAGSSD